MYKVGTLLLIILSVLTSCQSITDAGGGEIQSEDDSLPGESVEAAQAGDKPMTISIDEKEYLYTFADYPILSGYVKNFEDPVAQLESLSYRPLLDDQYLITFACHGDTCSHLLIDFKQKASFLLSDLSKLTKMNVSPDQAYASFLFERKHKNEPATNQLTVMDLDALQPASLELENEEQLMPRPNQFQYAIYSMSFVNQDTLKMESDPSPNSTEKDPITTTWMIH
ncbi:hypothetical protein LCM20_02720 [Halobacillus litoralis]|uniref:hypothetical protein n=1 Tax=Halobacillus litoralis TaxID=45668 RepID=UPI001CD4EAB4|nr:hypothetical protein [Halobacillus litoralis]MCA0969504.1 hypothetical protein [Halobacillus litoralis]